MVSDIHNAIAVNIAKDATACLDLYGRLFGVYKAYLGGIDCNLIGIANHDFAIIFLIDFGWRNS